MPKVKKTIPVYDIYTLGSVQHFQKTFTVMPFADYLKLHPNLHFSHRHSFYHLVLFTKGGGSHTIDFEQFKVKPGQIYFMVPGQVHGWSFDNKVDGYVINFSEELFRSFLMNQNYPEQFQFFRGIAKESIINLPVKTVTTAIQCIEEMLQEVTKQEAYNKDMICALLMELFITVERVGNSAGKNKTAQPNLLLLQNFRKLVDQYYTEKRLPKEYAAMLYVTPNHLNALCQDLLGKSSGETIRDRVLLECKRLLVNADLSVSEIAYQLSFTDNSYFTKFFKKYAGVTPEEFRKATETPA